MSKEVDMPCIAASVRPAHGRVALALALSGALAIALGCAGSSANEKKADADRKGRSHYDLGVDHLQGGRTGFAIREFQAAEALRPQDPWTQQGLAEAYRRRGMLTEAEAHLKRALELEPGFQAARLNLSALYVQMERFADAIAQARVLLADPTLPAQGQVKALSNLGYAQLRLGQLDDARRSLEEALEYADNFWQAQLNLGILEAQEGRRPEAIARFRRVLDVRPGPLAEAEANYRIAEVYISQGEREQALEHLGAAVANKPSGEWGKRSEEYLKLLR
jgi:Tfp pilus assembly protein PilF